MIKLVNGHHQVEFQLDKNGCIKQIVHTGCNGASWVDDVWSRKPRYRNRKPDFLIGGYLNSGWRRNGD